MPIDHNPRASNAWLAPPGASVLMSVLLFPPPPLRRPAVLTAWAAVAVCTVVRRVTGVPAKIKWPNDVLLRGRKVCGILIEQRRGTVADGCSGTAIQAATLKLLVPDTSKGTATSCDLTGGAPPIPTNCVVVATAAPCAVTITDSVTLPTSSWILPRANRPEDRRLFPFCSNGRNPDASTRTVYGPAPMVKFMVDAKQQNYYPPKGITGNHLAAEVLGSLFGDWPVNRYWTNTTYNLWGTDYMAMERKYAPGNQGLRHHITQSSAIGVNFFGEAARRVGPNLTRSALVNELRTGGVYDAGPGLDQKFAWGPQKNARELGGRTEYMFKLTSTDTSANDDATPNGFKPDPDKFVLVDDID